MMTRGAYTKGRSDFRLGSKRRRVDWQTIVLHWETGVECVCSATTSPIRHLDKSVGMPLKIAGTRRKYDYFTAKRKANIKGASPGGGVQIALRLLHVLQPAVYL